MGSDFKILGDLQVVQGGEPRELGSLRQRGLLARLIIGSGHPITTDRLIDELWPGDAPETARHTLHVYISRLRGALGSDRAKLRSDTTGYRLDIEPHELDASRFESLVADGRGALSRGDAQGASRQFREALDLWRGPALVEFVDEAFAIAEATRLDQIHLAVVEDRVWADLELGHHVALTEELRELTVQQPFREVRWEQYMLALYRSGRQADALHAYGEARIRLANDLGIEPGPALSLMEQRILAQDPDLSAAAPEPAAKADNLPLQRTTFVGRRRDLAIAGELLASSRLLTLTGAPGSGKTRMAVRLASERADRYPDGAFFVPLADLVDGGLLEAAIAAALQLPGSPADTLSERLVSFLRDRTLLLVLDNFEQIADAAAQVGHILDAAQRLTIMVTSRSPLGISGEQEFPVLPLSVPALDGALDPTTLSSCDAVALLVARARALDPAFDVTAENAAAIAGITARLDGLPLAIELGAGRLRLLTPQALLERLEGHLPLLATGASDAIARHQTLRNAIAWSYDLLEPAEQSLFRRLAPFAGGFTAEAAAAVADLPLEATWTGIESLLSKSLLGRPADVGEARFGMLQTLREFAAEELDRSGERDDVDRRHARYYLEIASVAEEDLTSTSREVAMERLSREIENIRAVLRRGLRGEDPELSLRLASSIWRFWLASGRLSEGRKWLAGLLAESRGTSVVRAKGIVALAGLAYWQADYEEAWSGYEEALALFRSMGDRANEADALYGLSMTATWMGDPAAGGRLAAEARSLFEEQGARAKVGELLMAQGFALWQDREHAAARPLWEEALAISRELGDDALAVTQLAGLAGLEFQTGDPAEAQRIILDALSQACHLENIALCVWLLDWVAAFAVAQAPIGAVRIAGAADALRKASGGGMSIEDVHIESARSAATRLLGREQLEQAWAQGRTMDLGMAIGEANGLQPVSID